ncbi:primosomal protein N', partial [Achromatium sp. WMS2]
MLQRLQRRFVGLYVALLHSERSPKTRTQDWLAARTGVAQVVLGTRLAVFTPMPKLQLVIVDEEHVISFKQQDRLRYSARDVAVWRGWKWGCPVILGTATPALETLHNALTGRYTHLKLSQRTGVAGSPKLNLIDTRNVPVQGGLTPALIKLLRDNIAFGHQSLLLLNRRGYAPVVMCYACGWIAGCDHCDARLTLHAGANELWCHHCGHKLPYPVCCPKCSSHKLKSVGQGTQRLEQTLAKLFGDVGIVRIDSDSTRGSGSLDSILKDAATGKYAILLGTQMLAKGHHLPGITLVGIIDVDQGLYGSDFRASERMAQLIIQAAGRAGRVSIPGQMVLQTRNPDHPLLQTLIRHGYTAFANLALQEREQATLPPFTALALLRAEATTLDLADEFLKQARNLAVVSAPNIEFWGPAPAAMVKRAGYHRSNLLMQALSRKTLQTFLRNFAAILRSLPASSKIRWALDVDPQEVS